MDWKIEIAKNGQYTLKLNGNYIYSKYNPEEDVKKQMTKYINKTVNSVVLIGLGLGYHLNFLLDKCLLKDSNIYVISLDSKEYEIFIQYGNKELLKRSNIHINLYNNFIDVPFEKSEIIIPLSFLKAMDRNHPLRSFLEDIKVKQLSYQKQSEKMQNNFKSNTKKNTSYFNFKYKEVFSKNDVSFLVSAGPSLSKTTNQLLKYKSKACIICVGSALPILLSKQIVPDIIVISDASDLVMKQLERSNSSSVLIAVSTANSKAFEQFKGYKMIVLQKDYSLAENMASKNKLPLIQTGGSVASAALSIIEIMGFKKVYLVGQDLGFKGNSTHDLNSTSCYTFSNQIEFEEVEANSGEKIHTMSNFNIFKRWFEWKASNTDMEIYNTAYDGAKIKGIPYISELELEEQLINKPDKNYMDIFLNKLKEG